MVELCTHLAIERARLVTSHLKLARLISIPTVSCFLKAATPSHSEGKILYRVIRIAEVEAPAEVQQEALAARSRR